MQTETVQTETAPAPVGVDGRGYYVCHNEGPGETFTAHWPDDEYSIRHDLTSVMSGPYVTKGDASKALVLAHRVNAQCGRRIARVVQIVEEFGDRGAIEAVRKSGLAR